MGKPTIDISYAMKAFNEGNEPIAVKEAARLIGRNVAAASFMSDNRRAILYEGTLEHVGHTFHPKVAAFLRLDYLGKRLWYKRGWLGWKRTPYAWGQTNIQNDEMESIASDITDVDVLFSEGSYYPVHVGKVLRHHMHEKPCEYCEISDAHKWVEVYKRYGLKHEKTRWMSGRDKAEKALQKYPKQLKTFFGADTTERLLKDLSKKH
jgi:hypothetical protein